jgi:hypothetical protein
VRIRQIKPDYWRDSVVGKMKDSTRLTYIGLWMVADDSGWFRSDIAEIATDLFPYLPTQHRERKVAEALEELGTLGRVVSHPCGHSEIPTLPLHQRLAVTTRRVDHTWAEHKRSCSTIPNDSTAFQTIPNDSTAFQTIPNDSTAFQPIPNDSKRFHGIPTDSTLVRDGKERKGTVSKGKVAAELDVPSLAAVKEVLERQGL